MTDWNEIHCCGVCPYKVMPARMCGHPWLKYEHKTIEEKERYNAYCNNSVRLHESCPLLREGITV